MKDNFKVYKDNVEILTIDKDMLLRDVHKQLIEAGVTNDDVIEIKQASL